MSKCIRQNSVVNPVSPPRVCRSVSLSRPHTCLPSENTEADRDRTHTGKNRFLNTQSHASYVHWECTKTKISDFSQLTFVSSNQITQDKL